jgi:hypothetical protein
MMAAPPLPVHQRRHVPQNGGHRNNRIQWRAVQQLGAGGCPERHFSLAGGTSTGTFAASAPASVVSPDCSAALLIVRPARVSAPNGAAMFKTEKAGSSKEPLPAIVPPDQLKAPCNRQSA